MAIVDSIIRHFLKKFDATNSIRISLGDYNYEIIIFAIENVELIKEDK